MTTATSPNSSRWAECDRQAIDVHLDRDRDLVHFAIARKRLLAGLGPPGARAMQFFVAEEGASAVAYVLINERGSEWMIEEAGDCDPSGARIGAILQALIARDPAERRPIVRGWLPAGLCPPQVGSSPASLQSEVMMIRPLTARGTPTSALGESEVVYWHGDVF